LATYGLCNPEIGRLEKDLNLPVTPGNDESLVSKEDAPKMFQQQQKMFHKNFTLPLFRLLALAYPVTKVPYLSILENVAEKEYGIDLNQK